MKKFIFIVLVVITASCNNTPTKVEDPKKETTIQIQQLAAIDTICYKVVELNDKIYILQDQMVVKKVDNNSGVKSTFVLFIVVLLVFLVIEAILSVAID